MPASFRTVIIVSLLLLSACSSLKRKSSVDSNGDSPLADMERNIKEDEVSSEDVERNIERPYQSAYGEIAMDYNPSVEKWLEYFQGRGRKHMEQYLSRSTRYLPMMKNTLRENGLPEDLVYVALIESGFSPRAHSRANAVGYWQFIRGTGKRFGLKIDTFTDERRDPVLSTRAAAEYFKALYGLLGSWHLSMAAYNVGEMRVKRAVTRFYTKDFWQLAKQRRSFPAETKNYVPKFIAAAMIAKNPAKYGFVDLDYQDPLSYDTVALQSPISLSKLAANLNVEVEELKLLNPKFRTDFVPILRGTETVVRIPVGRASDAMAALSMSVTSQPKMLQAEHFYYRIRRGDNLSMIARKHRTTVSQLRRINDLSNRSVLRVGQSLKVPDQGGDGVQYVTEEDAQVPSSNRGRRAVAAVDTVSAEFHFVRRGDNLSSIAKRYGIRVEDLRRWNNLGSRAVIRTGQRLRVRGGGEAQSVKFEGGSKAKVQRMERALSHAPLRGRKVTVANYPNPIKRHVVKRGETLYEVARQYRVDISQLARANNRNIGYRVVAGERLIIPD